MQYTIPQLKKIISKEANSVYEVFKNFFGEKFVDAHNTLIGYDIKKFLRGRGFISDDSDVADLDGDSLRCITEHFSETPYIIYVWWPTVTVTNEYNKSIVINDLYAKITIDLKGRIPYEQHGFLLNRATYTQAQFLSNYLHSHINCIPKNNFSEFRTPCLGTGPIKDTINTLKTDNDEVTWMLFCQELAMYVTVESISGVPYRRLENVGNKYKYTDYNDYNFFSRSSVPFTMLFTKEDLKNFTKYYLEHGHLVLSYKDGKYLSCMPYYDFIVDISNAFIDYYNSVLIKEVPDRRSLYGDNLLNEVLAADGKFYRFCDSSDSGNIDSYQDKYVLTFKGKDIHTYIIAQQNSQGTTTTLLNYRVAMFILYHILNIINYKYNYIYDGRNQEARTTSISSPVIYL